MDQGGEWAAVPEVELGPLQMCLRYKPWSVGMQLLLMEGALGPFLGP